MKEFVWILSLKVIIYTIRRILNTKLLIFNFV